MTELTIDSYFSKINDLTTLCLDPLTTTNILTSFFSELSTINSTLETELESLPFPTTTQHLRKLILLELERNDNSFIQSNLLKLIRVKEIYENEYVQTNYPISDSSPNPVWNSEDRNNFCMAYSTEIKDIKTTIHNIILNCSCMKNRKYIIINTRY